MPIAMNDAGDAVFLSPDGEWKPAILAENPQTKEKLAYDGKEWQPIKPKLNNDYSYGDVGMAALRGIPVAGGLIERNSSPQSQASYKNFDEAHPYISEAAKFGGGVLALGPLGMTGAGARALGMTGATLGRQMVNSALSGSVIGGLDAATRGDNIKDGAEIGGALGLAGPLAGRAIGSMIGGAKTAANAVTPVARIPQNFEQVGKVSVPIDRGQALGDVTTQRYLETARQGNFGEAAQREINAFRDQQAGAIDRAKGGIRGELGGPEVTPLEAADIAQQGIQQAAKTAKANYQTKYDEFGKMQGEVHAGAFENVGQKIKGDLSLTANPVIIDDVTTPAASKMIQHIDNGIGKIKIQNRADPFVAPNPENITGISLQGVDQARKQLRSIAGAASNDADRRATSAIMSSFDEKLQAAVDSHLYKGDPAALGTLKEARTLYSAYAQTFRGKGGMADNVIQNMLGKKGNPADHNQIANWMYGTSKIGGQSEATLVAGKIKSILGETSQEWQAVRQGLLSKLVDTIEGKIQDGPQKVSQRVHEFLNGSGKQLSEQIFTPKERALIAQYGSLMKKMTPLEGAVNHSGSGYQIASMIKWTLNSLATIGGLHVGGPMGALAGVAANIVGKGIIERNHTQSVARNIYSPAAFPVFPEFDPSKFQKGGALLSRALTGG